MNSIINLPPAQPNDRHVGILQQLKEFFKTQEGDNLFISSQKKIDRPSAKNCHAQRFAIIKAALKLPYNKLSLSNLEKATGISKPTLIKWIKRFLAGLSDWYEDSHRSGRPSVVTKEQLTQIHRAVHAKPQDLADEALPEHQAELITRSVWTLDILSKYVNLPRTTLFNCLISLNIKSLSKTKSWCLSLDPLYLEKSERVNEVYTELASRDDCIVVCFDEKTCIQAISYETYVFQNGKKVTASRYKRNGTTNLCAFLNIKTGEIYHEWLDKKNKEDICNLISRFCNKAEFMGKKIYIVLDNLATHKNFQTVDSEWYQKHPNVEFVFTPTCSSWMNQVETTFGIITRQVLKGASWHSVDELQEAVNSHIKLMNNNPKPYNWSLDIARNKSQRLHTLSSMAKTSGRGNIRELLLDGISKVYGDNHPIMKKCPFEYLIEGNHIKHINIDVPQTDFKHAVIGLRDYRTSCTVIP